MDFFSELSKQTVLPVLRYNDEEVCFQVAMALNRAGFQYVEVTLTNPNPYKIIERLAKEEVKVGAGTVLNKVHVIECENAGAGFIVSPGLSMEIVETCRIRNLPLTPGVATPTEIMKAINVNLEYLKLFPAGSMGGVKGLKNLRGPFPKIKFIPTGGVLPEEIAAYKEAGAFALGLSPRFINREDIQSKNWDNITKSAQNFLENKV